MGKYLGQHFLVNRNKIRKIIETLELKDGDVIIEIGPGHGELTNELKVKSLKLKVIAIEKDPKLAVSLELLAFRNKLESKIEIIKGDVLKILPEITKTQNPKPKTYKIVGNIPYYITGYLLRIFGELENKPSLIVLTIQKEVAERICGHANSARSAIVSRNANVPMRMNLLAASIQFWAKPEIVDYISRKDFQPAPKVDSAIIKLKVKSEERKANSYEVSLRKNNYYRFIKILFKQPRKTISNNLLVICRDAKNANTRECREKIIKKLNEIGVNPQARPQDLSIEQIKELSTLF